MLYPTAPAIYRRMGWEVVGSLDTTHLPIGLLPSSGAVRAAIEADVATIAGLYDGIAATTNGLLARTGSSFPKGFPSGYGALLDADVVSLVEEAGAVTGYVSYQRDNGYRALISSGWAKLGAGSAGSDVRVLGPTPHAKLFPRVAAIVHHGGAGTTSTAALAGTPQIVVPHLFDQSYWAARVAALGIGPRCIGRLALSAASLTRALAEVRRPVFAARAREVAKRVAAPMDFAQLAAALGTR